MYTHGKNLQSLAADSACTAASDDGDCIDAPSSLPGLAIRIAAQQKQQQEEQQYPTQSADPTQGTGAATVTMLDGAFDGPRPSYDPPLDRNPTFGKVGPALSEETVACGVASRPRVSESVCSGESGQPANPAKKLRMQYFQGDANEEGTDEVQSTFVPRQAALRAAVLQHPSLGTTFDTPATLSGYLNMPTRRPLATPRKLASATRHWAQSPSEPTRGLLANIALSSPRLAPLPRSNSLFPVPARVAHGRRMGQSPVSTMPQRSHRRNSRPHQEPLTPQGAGFPGDFTTHTPRLQPAVLPLLTPVDWEEPCGVPYVFGAFSLHNRKPWREAAALEAGCVGAHWTPFPLGSCADQTGAFYVPEPLPHALEVEE